MAATVLTGEMTYLLGFQWLKTQFKLDSAQEGEFLAFRSEKPQSVSALGHQRPGLGFFLFCLPSRRLQPFSSGQPRSNGPAFSQGQLGTRWVFSPKWLKEKHWAGFPWPGLSHTPMWDHPMVRGDLDAGPGLVTILPWSKKRGVKSLHQTTAYRGRTGCCHQRRQGAARRPKQQMVTSDHQLILEKRLQGTLWYNSNLQVHQPLCSSLPPSYHSTPCPVEGLSSWESYCKCQSGAFSRLPVSHQFSPQAGWENSLCQVSWSQRGILQVGWSGWIENAWLV